MTKESMKRGGCAELVIPADSVGEVVMFLQNILQRGNHLFAMAYDKQTGIYQLDPQNNWHLIPQHGDVYRLGARYNAQIIVDSIAVLTRWHFLLDGWVGYDGATHKRPEDVPVSHRWSSLSIEEEGAP